jgi:hypothetical protein
MKIRILFPAGLIVAAASSLGAQAASQSAISPPPPMHNTAPSASADCDYNTCALRMKLSRGAWRIIRGEQGERVGTLGAVRAPMLESIVATSPEAVAEARTFRSNYTSGAVLQIVGTLLMAAGIGAAEGHHSDVIAVTGVAGGAALLFYGVSRYAHAFNTLHKTIWLYNGSLKR